MAMETRLWRTGYAENLLTTVPKAVRVQLALGPDDRIAWRVEGGVAEVTKFENGAGQAYALYKQTRGSSLYTAVPMNVSEQLRLTDRSRAEWELAGSKAIVRRA